MLAADPTIRADIEIHRQRIERKRSVERLAYWIAALTLPAALVLQAAGHTPWLALLPFGVVAAWFLYREHNDKEAGINCPTCIGPGGGVPLISNWICGNCFKTNNPTALFRSRTFCEPCLYCTIRPSAVVCRQCREPIIFDEEAYNTNPKRLTFLPNYPPPKPEPEEAPKPPTLDELIPFKDRQTHTMIVGSTGSGKTEAMKQFIHSLLSQNVAGVVIDPHGDMAKEVAHWKNDRLIYLDPSLQKGYSPTINPFEIYGIDAADVSDDALAVKRVISQQLLSALQEITAAGERSEITKNMQTILNARILSLLDLQNATIRDLQRYMDDNRNLELVKFGSSRHHYPDVSEFFRHNFHNKAHLRLAKDAIFTKLQDLLTTGFFADLTCGKSSIHLQQAWNERKILVCHLGAGAIGKRESAAFGRLLLNTLQGIAMRSADIDQEQRIPCHVFIDEAYMFVTPSIDKILRQAREYKLVLTLAAQQIGQMSKDLETTIRDSANVQLVGVTKPPNYKTTASMFHLEVDDIARLTTGTFLARVGNNRPLYITFSNALVGDKAAMPPYEWGHVKQDQIRRYYRPVQRAVPDETSTGIVAIQEALAKAAPTLANITPTVVPTSKSKKRTLAVDDTEGDVI